MHLCCAMHLGGARRPQHCLGHSLKQARPLVWLVNVATIVSDIPLTQELC